jgi:hypothetical protein
MPPVGPKDLTMSISVDAKELMRAMDAIRDQCNASMREAVDGLARNIAGIPPRFCAPIIESPYVPAGTAYVVADNGPTVVCAVGSLAFAGTSRVKPDAPPVRRAIDLGGVKEKP